MNLNRPTAIVTGGGSGIGRETSIQLAAAGYDLALVGRNRHKLDQTAAMIAQSPFGGTAVQLIPTDLCDSHATRRVATATVARFGRIDAVANVAGYAPMMPIEQVTPEVWDSVVNTNLSPIVNLTAAVWPVMVQNNGGIIVNISSMASADPFPGLSVYATVKAAVNMFTRCTAQEGQDVGLRAVAIAPGAVETAMLRSLFDESMIPPSQTLDAKTVAKMVLDCITGSRPFEPGQTIWMPSPSGAAAR